MCIINMECIHSDVIVMDNRTSHEYNKTLNTSDQNIPSSIDL